MLSTWLLSSIHLLAVAVGFAAICARAALLRRVRDASALRPVFLVDNVWGITALVLLGTGLWRLFGATDKPSAYYLDNDAFWVKMSLLGLILVLEIWPMMTLIRWRIAQARGNAVTLNASRAFARVSILQAHLLGAMIFAATAMARGYFY